MKVINRILGVLGVILGVVGVILAVVLVIGIWLVNPTITQGLQDTARTMNESLIVADRVLTAADIIAGDLRVGLQVNEGDLQPMIDKYHASLGQIRTTIDTINSAIGVGQELVGLVNSFPFLAGSVSQLPQTETLAGMAQTLENLSQTLTDLEQESPKLAQAGRQALARIDSRLGKIEVNIEQLVATVKQAQADLARTEARIPFLVKVSSIILSFVAVWFGLAQYCLLVLAWRWAAGAKALASEEGQPSY